MTGSVKSYFSSSDAQWRAEWMRRHGDKAAHKSKSAKIVVYHK